MRLTCPNCGAEYQVPEGMLPTAGRHVQCTVCHTRWFVRGGPRAEFSEDQILSRLETWSPRPRPVAVPDPAPPADAVTVPEASEPADLAPPPEPEPSAPPPVPEPVAPPRRSGPDKPAERPAVPRPGPLAEAPAPPPPRSAPRLELGAETSVLTAAATAPQSGRFWRGMLLALLLGLLALGAYLYRDAIAARVPAAAPALESYGSTVDGWRDQIEQRLAPLRQDLSGA